MVVRASSRCLSAFSWFWKLVLVGLVAPVILVVGCQWRDDGHAGLTGPGAPVSVPTTDLQLGVTLSLPASPTPGGGPTSSRTALDAAAGLRADATGTRQVTFTLTSIDATSVTQPIATRSLTVAIDATGRAVATFSGVPMQPILAAAHLEGVAVASYTDFHGALDLGPGLNRLTLVGRGSRSVADVVATTVGRFAVSSVLARAPTPLVAGIASLVAALDRTAPAVYDTAFATVANTVTQSATFTAGLTWSLASASGRQLKPSLAVNCGPMAAGNPGNAEVVSQYREIGVTTIRTHDYYGPLDMATMYPNQSADPASAASYDFTVSDQYFQTVVNNGFVPYFRVGDSWSANAPYVTPNPRKPTNFGNWARAAVEVVRRYQDAARWGRNHLNMIELWNEPDFSQFWDGSPPEFCTLYASTAIQLRAAFPTLQIGGPAFTQGVAMVPSGKAFLDLFLETLASRAAPLDFLSWHIYSNDPVEYGSAAYYIRQRLDHFGFTAAKSVVSEFHTSTNGLSTAEASALRVGGRGAAIITAAWIKFQEQGVDLAIVYRGNDTALAFPQFHGLFKADGTPKKTPLAFSLWRTMAGYANHLNAPVLAGNASGVAMLAGQNGAGEVAVLVANYGSAPVTWSLAPASGADISLRYRLVVSTVSDAAEQVVTSAPTTLPLTSEGYSVQLVVLTPR